MSFQKLLARCKWRDEYLVLRTEGWDWRKAAYIAWASSPAKERWPANQELLASNVLGLKSDRTIRKWRENDATIDDRVALMQIEPMMKHRRDVIEALVRVAMVPHPKAHQDRKLFLEMTGDYKPRGALALTGEDGGPIEIDLETEYRQDMAELAEILMRASGQELPAESEIIGEADT